MIGLLVGVWHYLEAAFIATDDDNSIMYGEYLGENPTQHQIDNARVRYEMYCEDLLREQEQQYQHEVNHGWEDTWVDSFIE